MVKKIIMSRLATLGPTKEIHWAAIAKGANVGCCI